MIWSNRIRYSEASSITLLLTLMKANNLPIITLLAVVLIVGISSKNVLISNDLTVSDNLLQNKQHFSEVQIGMKNEQQEIDSADQNSQYDDDNKDGQDDSTTQNGGINEDNGKQDDGGKHSEDDDGDENQNEQDEQKQGAGHHYLHPSQSQFWINALIAALLTCVGGFCSGMTVGLMSIEKIQLQIMGMSKDPDQNKIAKKILSVVSDHHLFLVTLLVANAMALQSLPLIVHSLMPDWAAIIFSTVIVLIGAQIVPQAFCTGPKKITIAYYACPIILVMIKVFYIIAYPIAKGLDSLLGKHEHQRIQHKDFANFLGDSQNLKSTEKLLLTSILELRTERVTSIMIDLQKLYMLSMEDRLTPSKITEINKKDYSYILVHKDKNKTKIMGVIKTKQFALQFLKKNSQDKAQGVAGKVYKVSDFFTGDHGVLSVYEDTNLLQMLMLLQAKSFRFALVIGKKRKVWPGIQSIMYSKSDMIAAKQEGQLLGVVFLYSIFQEIAEFHQQIATNTVRALETNISQEMKQVTHQLKKPLLKQERF